MHRITQTKNESDKDNKETLICDEQEENCLIVCISPSYGPTANVKGVESSTTIHSPSCLSLPLSLPPPLLCFFFPVVEAAAAAAAGPALTDTSYVGCHTIRSLISAPQLKPTQQITSKEEGRKGKNIIEDVTLRLVPLVRGWP